MNRLEKYEEGMGIYNKYGWECQTCGESVHKYCTAQLAHKIARTKENYSKYGAAVIDHPLNRVPTCCLECNGKQNIGHSPVACGELVEEINNGRPE